MTTFYFVALTNSDGTPSDVDVGGAATENGAAKVALHMANSYKRDTVVIGLNASTGEKKVLQTVRYVEGGATIPPEPKPELPTAFDRHYMRGGTVITACDFVLEWIVKGYTVTVSPVDAVTLLVDAEASKRK